MIIYEVTAAEDPDLEAYRVQALAELEEDIIPTLYSLVESVLGQRPVTIQPIGSILDPDRFHEDSDIDVGVYFQQGGEMSEYYSEELQKEMIRYPFGMLGVLNTVVFGEPRTREESVNNNRKALNERVTPSDLSQVETYVDKLFDKVGVDVEFTRHFHDRVNDKRNKKPITTAELIRIFRETYKKYGKKIPKLGPEAQAVLRDLKTNINIPFALEVDKNGDLDLISKTIMRKDDFKTSNPVLAVENNMADPKKILEYLTTSRDQKIKETMNGDTVSRKFFTMIEDTVSDFEAADGQLSDEERARLVAVFLNGQAKKFLGDSKSIWPLACQKLVEICGTKGGGSTHTPQEEPEPQQQQMGGFQPPRPGNPFHMESENVRYLGLTEGLTHKIAENIIKEMAASVGPEFPEEKDIKFFDPNGNRMDPKEMPPTHKKVFKAAIKYLKDNPNTTQRLSTKHHKFNMQVTGDGNVALIDDEGEKLTILKAGKDLKV